MPMNRAMALDALRSGDLLELGISANQIRQKLHPAGVVTYALRAATPSQNSATHSLTFAEDRSVYLTDIGDLEQMSLDALKTLLAAWHVQSPEVTFQHLLVSSRCLFAQDLLALAESLPRLESTGLGSLQIELETAQLPAFSREDLASFLRMAAKSRLFISATVIIGQGESLDARIETLEMLRALQQDSNALHAVRIQVHHSNAPGARREEEATAVDYLRTLAVARVLLDNIEHLQADWSVMGPKVLELALRFGANDAGTISRSQGNSKEPSHHGGESELRRIIRDAGFQPVERDALFRQSLLH
jgi:cyclic dehypoxanthinyl futalosine synthase